MESQKSLLDLWHQEFRGTSDVNIASLLIELLNDIDVLMVSQRSRIIWYIIHEYISKMYSIFYITLQPVITDILPGGRVIRPDIYIWHPHYSDFKVIVECDGYTYHSDKASFSNDRARDRLLHMKGYRVLRFSGQDIFNNPTEMARELHQYLIGQKRNIQPFYLK